MECSKCGSVVVQFHTGETIATCECKAPIVADMGKVVCTAKGDLNR